MPVYNVEKYVEEALTSILNQTYRTIEIILIDDCSTDSTFEKCLKVSRYDDRVRLYKNEKNSKICFTLNRALYLSKGDLIARMDGDDISCCDRIALKVKFLELNPKVALVGCSLNAINGAGDYIGKTKHYADFRFLKRTIKYITPCSHVWVARRSLYEDLNGYREIAGAEDYDFLLRAITAGYIISNLENYYGYTVRIARVGNTSSVSGARQRLLQKYVFFLYSERVKNGCDNHCDILMEKAVVQSDLSKKLFLISNRCLMKGLQSRGLTRLPLKLFYFVLALCSPIQTKYLMIRIIYKILCLAK
jgi:glycosyltransferase involved in cell wall biosynthesis